MTVATMGLGYHPTAYGEVRCVAPSRRPSMSQGEPARASSPALAPAEAALADRAFDEGVAAHGVTNLDRQAFRAAILARAARQAVALGIPPTAATLEEFVRRAALDDLFLAVACEVGDERAWASLSTTLRSRLEGLAVRRGLGSADAQSLVQDVLGDLSRPPPSGAARTLVGTFDGSGSLFAWLAVGLVRRIAARARSRQVGSLDALDGVARDAATPAQVQGRPPSDAVADGETERRFRAALAVAWKRLSGRQRLAVVWKHRDGLTQRRIGDLLGVGESRVSRVVSEAVERLAAGVRETLAREDGAAVGSDLWGRLAAAVASHLSKVEVSPPSGEEREDR